MSHRAALLFLQARDFFPKENGRGTCEGEGTDSEEVQGRLTTNS